MRFLQRPNSGNPVPNEPDKLPAYMTGATPPTDGGQPVSLSKAAKVSVLKRPSFNGRKFALYFGADISYSMTGFISSGALDYVTEAISTVSYENGWDADNIVPSFPYGENVSMEPYLVELGQHAGVGNRIVQHGERQRVSRAGTQFAPPVNAIFNHYRKSDDWGVNPAIAFIQTDGMNSDMTRLKRDLTDYSREPIHWVFVYFGDIDPDGNDQAKNLRLLDSGATMPGRKVDNVSVFLAGPEPKRVTPLELYDGLLEGPAAWITEASQAGIL